RDRGCARDRDRGDRAGHRGRRLRPGRLRRPLPLPRAAGAGGGVLQRCDARPAGAPRSERPMTVRLLPGAKRRLLDASPSAEVPWYINDHTLIRAADGRWHLFGIWHPEPAAPLDETMFLHASADDLEGAQWTIHDPVLHARREQGETHVWAPHAIHHDGRCWMFYAGGTSDHAAYRMSLATSEDLFTWTRHEQVLFEDGFDARDPMVLHDGRRWLMYYTRTAAPEGGFHQVAVRTSADLL